MVSNIYRKDITVGENIIATIKMRNNYGNFSNVAIALAKSNGKLFAIAFKMEKER